MTLVGKEFPNLAVDAMNEMGDTFKVNILEEAKSKNKRQKLIKLLKRLLSPHQRQSHLKLVEKPPWLKIFLRVKLWLMFLKA